MGGIGQVVARRMLGWDMKVIYHNRREISPKPDFPCEYKATLDELLREADVVSLHMPVRPCSFPEYLLALI
jgi:glyoxylate reductase